MYKKKEKFKFVTNNTVSSLTLVSNNSGKNNKMNKGYIAIVVV